jgi:hypothetical protein
MTPGHEPNPEFISGLESHLASELRRQQRFGSIGRPGKSARISRTAILLVLCVAVGVAAAKTVEHIEASQQKALLLARVETTIELLQSRQSVAREVVRQVEERVEAGLLHSKELEEAVSRSMLLDHELDRAYLDLDEVHLTGQAPRNELHAPLQDGRDFVTERLEVEYRVVSATAEPIASRRARMLKLVEAGLAHQSQMDRIDLELEKVDRQLEDIQSRLDLRAAFLSGEVTAKQAAMRRMLHGARARLRSSVNEEDAAVAQLERISRAEASGLASTLDVRRAESRLASARAEQRLAAIELELLEQELGEGESP